MSESGEGLEREERRLKGGELLILERAPGEAWHIRYCEHSERMEPLPTVSEQLGSVKRVVVGGLSWRNDIPQEWRDASFKSVDEAVAFVENEIAAGVLG